MGDVKRLLVVALVLNLAGSLLNIPLASANAPLGPNWGDTDSFWMTWDRTDALVADHSVNRTWMWGPEDGSIGDVRELYQDAPGGWRTVHYFDKSRMEITHPADDPTATWYVTNGLLAEELITGRVQLGDNVFDQEAPAPVNVAGDANDPNGPTYATFNTLMGATPPADGTTIIDSVNRAGQVSADTSMVSYGVTAKNVGAPTNHTVASVFWDFMNSSGQIEQVQSYDASTRSWRYVITDGNLFSNPYYATGFPLTEPYWTHVLVGGVSKLVLVQVFERRVLTYTPSNPDGWKVEAGNVGQHYFTWRYSLTDLQKDVSASIPANVQQAMSTCITTTVGQYGTVGPAFFTAPGSMNAALQVATTYWGGSLADDLLQGIPQSGGITFDNEAIVVQYADVADACDTAAHEYYHLVQRVQSRFTYSSVPLWFVEGTATDVGGQAMAAAGYVSTNQWRAYQMDNARQFNMSLLDSSNDVNAKYVLGSLAADWLDTHCGNSCFNTFWVDLGKTQDWPTAFSQAFGLSVDDFYTQFAQYRAQNFPPG